MLFPRAARLRLRGLALARLRGCAAARRDASARVGPPSSAAGPPPILQGSVPEEEEEEDWSAPERQPIASDESGGGGVWPAEHVGGLLPIRRSRPSWGTAPDFDLRDRHSYLQAVETLDLSTGPQALANLLRANNCPHPREVYRDIVAHLSKQKLRDAVVATLLNHCATRAKGMRRTASRKELDAEFALASEIFFQAIKDRHHIGAMSNTAFISCSAQCARPDVGRQTLRRMKQLGLPCPAASYCALINAYARSANPSEQGCQQLQQAWEIFHELARDAPFPDKRDTANIQHTLAVAAVGLLTGASRTLQPDEARRVWGLLVEKWKVPPNVQMYTAMIKVHAACGDVDKVLKMWEDMKDQGIQPSSRTCVAVLSTLGDRKDHANIAESRVEELAEVWHSTGDEDYCPGVAVLTALMRVYKQLGDDKGMVSVYRRMRRGTRSRAVDPPPRIERVEPSPLTWSVILSHCKHKAKFPSDSYCRLARQVWERALSGTVELQKQFMLGSPQPLRNTLSQDAAAPAPNLQLQLLALGVFAAAGDRAGVLMVYEKMKVTNTLANPVAQKPVALALRAVKCTGQAEQVELMLDEHRAKRKAMLEASSRPRDAARRARMREQLETEPI
eukprot:TRINITY_DN15016_c0_g1_i1.p1 TRINITY_DN15016_c0_g1~~TRINITY_DN15016_c0_g1_i1.p1  ORF type:complete len:651 (+),score=205.74 TRINITY_DN15016_c0_g1_i1:99-1955(+)